ncbi:MAG: iron-containing alcohol dehydrogenase [Polyangiales bacterium]
MIQTWSYPTRVLFGAGSVSLVGVEARALGARHVLVVGDRGVEKAGLLLPVLTSLDDEGIGHQEYLDVRGNPTQSDVIDGLDAYRKAHADLIVAIGGGSALDVAKLIALSVNHAPPLFQYDDAIGGDKKIVHTVPSVIAIPTTAGTGSEVGRSGVITIDHRKTVIFSPKLMPAIAILDPELSTTLPPTLTAATGLDALTHCVEAYLAIGDHPAADATALAGIELCARSLETAITDGRDIGARGDMLKAAMLGAMAFQKGLGACHSMAHPLSAIADVHHGLANAICLGAVIRFNHQSVPDRVHRIRQTWTQHAKGVASERDQSIEASIDRLLEITGLPRTLSSAGIAKTQITELAPLAMADGCHALNPRRCTQDDFLALYTEVY